MEIYDRNTPSPGLSSLQNEEDMEENKWFLKTALPN
jgi:hypothetical protein